ncbi:MAG TPA: hypothetical protein EYP36_00655 [Calditrichaeota bacterium]|nr:hypothetical protein [Calditrichota bacterium]
MGAPVVHFEILGKNTTKLQKFFSTVFDWKIDTDNPIGYGLIKPQRDNSIGGGIGSAGKVKGYATFYIEVDDLDKTLLKIEKTAAKLLYPLPLFPIW